MRQWIHHHRRLPARSGLGARPSELPMIQVTLISHSPEPMRSLYMAYRTCYSQLTPQQVLRRIDDDRVTEAQMKEFIEERLKTGHASPLEQVTFEFAISGVSRAFSHQFVRHRVGISFEQQS